MRLFTLIPAAGESRRFREVGYHTAKPFLSVGPDGGAETTMLRAVANRAPPGSTILAAVRANEADQTDEDISYVELWRTTRGQAETVDILASLVPREAAVLVCNVDAVTTYPLGSLVDACQRMGATAGVLSMPSTDPAHSYVSGLPWVTSTYEKQVVGNTAVAGFYYFRSAGNLRDAIHRHMHDRETRHELYLTPVLNSIISTHAYPSVLNVPLPPEHKVISWGTPEEYERNARHPLP